MLSTQFFEAFSQNDCDQIKTLIDNNSTQLSSENISPQSQQAYYYNCLLNKDPANNLTTVINYIGGFTAKTDNVHVNDLCINLLSLNDQKVITLTDEQLTKINAVLNTDLLDYKIYLVRKAIKEMGEKIQASQFSDQEVTNTKQIFDENFVAVCKMIAMVVSTDEWNAITDSICKFYKVYYPDTQIDCCK